MHKLKNNWSKEWPIEPGPYWFYGWSFNKHHHPPALHYVTVHKHKDNILHITSGRILFNDIGAIGLWQPANVPTDLPGGTAMDVLRQEEEARHESQGLRYMKE